MEYCERSVWIVGLVCFFLVLLGISTVVGTMYLYLVPYMWRTYHPLTFTVYITYGHYLLVNICYHYFKGVYTSPGWAPKISGFQPERAELKKGWTYCNKCECPKPPRAHHCRICNRQDNLLQVYSSLYLISISSNPCPFFPSLLAPPSPPQSLSSPLLHPTPLLCSFSIFFPALLHARNRCVLKMDHHCPWMFNCIGHYNHRYFMFFIIYMWLGTAFVIHTQWARVLVLLNTTSESFLSFLGNFGLRGTMETAIEAGPPVGNESGLVIMVFFICVGVTVALSILGGWHLFLISVSETTIEFYLNKREAMKLRKEGKKFHNAYSFGCINNWLFFLGLVNGRRDKPRAIPVKKKEINYENLK
ncbi:hypothetical protein EMCRGX_G029647 [Ephydatia muelleri]